MARYMEIAGEANNLALKLLAIVPDEDKPQAAEMIARLVNYGIRCSPRGVQHTVRLNAVQRAVCKMPVRVHMRQATNEKTGKTYNALITEAITTPTSVDPVFDSAGNRIATIEGEGEDV